MSRENSRGTATPSRRRPRRILNLGLPLLFLAALGGAGLAWRAAGANPAQGEPVAITVYKSPTCGCCHLWVEHMQEAGFVPTVHDIPDVTPVKEEHGVPGVLGSCHTTVVDGYVLEGHVPADVVRKLLRERPAVAGLAVPGMPMGAPGMGKGGGYNVISFTRDGQTEVYARK